MAGFRYITDIAVEGGCYEKETLLKGVLSNHLNLLYGRNGSGKSTLSRAICEWSNSIEGKYKIDFQNEKGDTLDDSLRESIAVFNEDFINDNLRLKDEEGIGTIAIIGNDTKVDIDLDKLEEELKDLQDKLEKTDQDIATCKSKIEDLGKKLDKSLKGSRCYAERGRDIKGLQNKITVKLDDIYQDRNNASNYPTISGLLSQLSSNMEKLAKTKGQNTISNWTAAYPALPDLDAINAELQCAVAKPEISDDMKHIIDLCANAEHHHYLEDAKKELIQKEAKFCPLCQQPLTQDYLNGLYQRISIALNDEVEQHQQRLKALSASIPTFALPAFEGFMTQSSCDAATLAFNALNGFMDQLRQQLAAKADNPHNAVQPIDKEQASTFIEPCQKALQVLADEINDYNTAIKERNRLIRESELLNRALAYMENQTDFDDYYKLLKQQDLLKNEKDSNSNTLDGKKRQYELTKAKLGNTSTAMQAINRCLSFVFSENKRLQLVISTEKEGYYKLQSNGRDVRPGDISTGERNIIALSYFFIKLSEGRNYDRRYDDSRLIVIDDPITSFDYGNRIGMLAMMRMNITEFLKGNKDSKVLVLTHDRQTINELVTINQNNIMQELEDDYTDEALKHRYNCYYDLNQRKMLERNDKASEYEELMKNIYRFVVSDDPYDARFIGIGNQMRRVMESYCTSLYHKGIKDVLGNDHNYGDLWKQIDKLQFYKNTLNKIVMDLESHNINILDGPIASSGYDKEDLRFYAAMLLLFLFRNNRSHIYGYLNRPLDSAQDTIPMSNHIKHWAEHDNSKEELMREIKGAC